MQVVVNFMGETPKDSANEIDWESPEIKAQVEDWGQKTTFGILAGMFYGGIKEGYESAHWQPLLPAQPGSKTWKERQEIWRKMWEQRMLRVAGGTVTGGAKLGLFTGFFYGIQKALNVHRGNDVLNTVAAGSTTLAIIGIILPGSIPRRLRMGLLGSIMGGVLSFPIGYVETKLSALEQEKKAQIQEAQAAVK